MRRSLQALFVASLWTAAAIAGGEEAREHPLLKGVRSPEVWNREWPGTLHDKLLTGFSPLNCGMKQAPKVWATIHPGGRATCAAFLTDEQGEGFLLVQDGSLRRIGPEGNVVWQYPAGGILFYDQLHGDGAYTLGVQRGSTLVLIEPRTGEPFWQQPIEGTIGPDKVRVARLHPDYPGKQIVVFPQYVTVAYMFAFPEGRRQPEQVWKTTDAAVANWPISADHGVTTVVEPDGSVIWNVRHHTINTHDPVTGKLVRRFEFKSGGGKRRNYGPTVIGPSPDGEPLLAIVGQFVQHHLTCFRRTQSEPPSLILDRYVGEVYGTHGVRIWLPVGGLGDADGDGGLPSHISQGRHSVDEEKLPFDRSLSPSRSLRRTQIRSQTRNYRSRNTLRNLPGHGPACQGEHGSRVAKRDRREVAENTQQLVPVEY